MKHLSSALGRVVLCCLLLASSTTTASAQFGSFSSSLCGAPARVEVPTNYFTDYSTVRLSSGEILTEVVNFLLPGNYTIQVLTEESVWQNAITFDIDILLEPEAFDFEILLPTTCSTSDGAVIITDPNTDDYQYSIRELPGGTHNFGNQINFFGLTAGEYEIAARSRYNFSASCTRLHNLSLFPANTPKFTATAMAASVCNGSDGSITLVSATGNLEYSLDGSNFQTSAVFNGLSPGVFTVTGRGGPGSSNDCTAQLTVVVGEAPAVPVAIQLSGNNPTACGREDGNIQVISPTSSAGYEFRLNGGPWQLSASFFALPQGLHLLETRLSGSTSEDCLASENIFLEDPVAPTLSLSVTDPSACGANDGTVLISGAGTGPYDYFVRHGGLTTQLTGNSYDELQAGEVYDFYIRPTNTTQIWSCRTSATIVVTQPAAPILSATATDPTTCGNSNGNGSITVFEQNGQNIFFADPATGDPIFNGNPGMLTELEQGEYEFLVYPAAAGFFGAPAQCYTNLIVQLDDPSVGGISINKEDPTGCGVEDGWIYFQPRSRHPDYEYEFKLGSSAWQSDSLFENLGDGFRTPSVRPVGLPPSAGCEDSYFPVGLDDPVAPDLMLNSQNPSACGLNDGHIELISSGPGVLEYSVDGNIFGNLSMIEDLDGGNYNATVRPLNTTDPENCSATLSVQLAEPAAPTLNLTASDPSGCGLADGSILLDGQPSNNEELEYSSNGVDFFSTINATNLVAANYTYFLRPVGTQDAAGCTSSQSQNLSNPTAPTLTAGATDLSGCGLNDATISIMGTPSGSEVLEYSFNGGAFNGITTYPNQVAGDYVITVQPLGTIDPVNCGSDFNLSIDPVATPTLSLNAIDPSACGLENGSIILTGTAALSEILEYSSDGINFSSTTSFSNLAGGNYTYFVRPQGTQDELGCTSSQSQNLSNPAAPTLTAGATNLSGCGLNDATISIMGSPNGSEVLEYSFNGGSFNNITTYSNQTSGTYTISVQPLGTTDSDNCSSDFNLSIDPIAAPTLSLNAIDPSACGLEDGSIILTGAAALSETLEYSSDGINFSSTTSFSNLTGGNYTYFVRPQGTQDAAACTVTQSQDLFTPAAPTLQLTAIAPTGCGLADGNISLSGNGAGIYEYSDDGINFNNTINYPDLIGGNYSFHIRPQGTQDVAGCTSSQFQNLSNPAAPTLTVSATALSGCGLNDATISIMGSPSGSEVLEYSFNGGSFNNITIYSNQESGAYTVSVQPLGTTDSDNCSSDFNLSIDPIAAPTLSLNAIDPSACGLEDGSIILTGTATLSEILEYSSDGINFSSTTSFSNLTGGNYTYFVRPQSTQDAAACTVTQSQNLITPAAPVLSLSAEDPSACGRADGQIIVTTTGAGPFEYSLNDDFGLLPDLDDLTAGSYTLSVRPINTSDALGCSDSEQVNLQQPEVPILTAVPNDPSQCGLSDGMISLAAIGADAFVFQLNDNPFGAASAFTDLAAATYLLSVLPTESLLPEICMASLQLDLENPAVPAVEVNLMNPTNCGAQDGQISVGFPVAGAYDLQLEFSDGTLGPWTTTADFTQLEEGVYTLRYRLNTSVDCIEEVLISLDAEDAPTLELQAVAPSNCGLLDGSILITPPATGSYEYRLGVDGSWSQNQTVNNLSGGQEYAIFIRPFNTANACLGSATINLPVGPLATPAVDLQIPTDCAANNGTAELTTIGNPNNEYEYRLLNSDGSSSDWTTSGSLNNLSAITYTAEIRMNGNDNCLLELPFDLTTNVSPSLSVINSQDPAFCGATDGVLTVSAGLGNNYAYSLFENNSFSASNNFTELIAGAYTIYVRPLDQGAVACVGQTSFTLGEPAPLSGEIIITPPSDCGDNSGGVQINAPIGNYDWSYSLFDGQGQLISINGPGFDNLTNGNYTLRQEMETAAHCFVENEFSINTTIEPTLNLLGLNAPTYCGGSDGEVSLVNSNFTANYEYSLDDEGGPYQLELPMNGLESGVHTVYIRPSNFVLQEGCLGTLSFEIPEGPIVDFAIFSQQPGACDAADGVLQLIPDVLELNYQYQLLDSLGQLLFSNEDGLFEGLTAASYTVELWTNSEEDCSVSQVVNLISSGAPQVAAGIAVDPTECGIANGSFSVQNLDGNDYIYALNTDGPFQNEPFFDDLSAGSHTIYVRLAGSTNAACESLVTFQLTTPELPVANMEIDLPPFCTQANAAINVFLSGPTYSLVEYQLQYPNGDFSNYQPSPLFEDLDIGNYTLFIRYNNSDNCLETLEFEIENSRNELAINPGLEIQSVNTCLDQLGSLQLTAGNANSSFFSVDAGPWQALNEILNLSPGTYQLQTALTATGCGATEGIDFVVEQIDTLLLQPSAISDPSSCALNDGQIIINVAGLDLSNLEYTIDGGETWLAQSSYFNLPSANYQVGVRHPNFAINGCQEMAAQSIGLRAPDLPEITALTYEQVDACNGATANIEIIANIPNGDNLLYSLDGGQSWSDNPSFSPVFTGTYIVSVRAADDVNNNCPISWPDSIQIDSIVSGVAPELEISNLLQPSNCALTDGNINFLISAAGNFQYSIDNGSSWSDTGNFENLPPGAYMLAVQDIDGDCIYLDQQLVILHAPDGPVIRDILSSPLSDCDSTDASIELISIGSPAGTEFSLDGGTSWQAGGTFTELPAGIYQLLARDPITGCTFSWFETIEIEALIPAVAEDFNWTGLSDCNLSDGSVSVLFSNTEIGSIIEIDGPVFDLSDNGQIDNLPAGFYQLSITNSAGLCRQLLMDSLQITPPAVIRLDSIQSQDLSSCFGNDGSITFFPTNPEWEYSINVDQDWQDGTSFVGLSGGVYWPRVRARAFPNCENIGDSIHLLSSFDPGINLTANWNAIDQCQEFPEGNIIISGALSEQLYSLNGGQIWSPASDLPQLAADQDYSLSVASLDTSCVLIDYLNIGAISTAFIQIQLDTIIPGSCNNIADGQLWVSAVGDIEGLDFRWSDGSTEMERANLLPGIYQVWATNANGCEDSLSVDLTAGSSNFDVYLDHFPDSTLCGAGTAIYDLTAYPEININWTGPNNFSSDQNLVSLTESGIYHYVLTNSAGCSLNDSLELVFVDGASVFADFLLPAQGVLGQPVVAIDITWPRPDTTWWNLQQANILDLGSLANQQLLEFTAVGIFEIGLSARVGDCTSELIKPIEIVATPEELIVPQPELVGEIRDFVVFPNPNFGNFRLRAILGLRVPAEVLLFDENGVLIERTFLPDLLAHEIDFDIVDRPAGVYPLVLLTPNEYRYVNVAKQ